GRRHHRRAALACRARHPLARHRGRNGGLPAEPVGAGRQADLYPGSHPGRRGLEGRSRRGSRAGPPGRNGGRTRPARPRDAAVLRSGAGSRLPRTDLGGGLSGGRVGAGEVPSGRGGGPGEARGPRSAGPPAGGSGEPRPGRADLCGAASPREAARTRLRPGVPLMRRALLVIAALVALPVSASAFVRSRTNAGACLFWESRTIPWTMNERGLPGLGYERAHAAFARAFRTWEEVECSDISFVDRSPSSETRVGHG